MADYCIIRSDVHLSYTCSTVYTCTAEPVQVYRGHIVNSHALTLWLCWGLVEFTAPGWFAVKSYECVNQRSALLSVNLLTVRRRRLPVSIGSMLADRPRVGVAFAVAPLSLIHI